MVTGNHRSRRVREVAGGGVMMDTGRMMKADEIFEEGYGNDGMKF